VLPVSLGKQLQAWWRRAIAVSFSRLRRLEPVSRVFGLDRGRPLDRYYIEAFLQANAGDISGEVLEIGDDTYTRWFGGGKVVRSDVLHRVPGNLVATMVGNLETGEGVARKAFTCMILTQTLPFIYDVRKAISTCHHALVPGGVLLATIPGISQISRYDADRWGDFWRFTEQSATQLFGEVFRPENITVQSHGNVRVACAFLHGLASHELTEKELDYHDPDYPVLITVRALKDGSLP